MSRFDKKVVLETILKEAPILTNLRKEISIGDGKRKVDIYAYYWNQGIPDSELKYDREKNPLPSKPSSTLCEIYSCWRNKPGEYSGPWVDKHYFEITNSSFAIRDGARLQFLHSPVYFTEHFNKICEKLDYEPRFNGRHVEIRRKAELKVNGELMKGEIIIDDYIGVDLERIDPNLSKILNLIESVYERVKKKDIPKSFIFVKSH